MLGAYKMEDVRKVFARIALISEWVFSELTPRRLTASSLIDYRDRAEFEDARRELATAHNFLLCESTYSNIQRRYEIFGNWFGAEKEDDEEEPEWKLSNFRGLWPGAANPADVVRAGSSYLPQELWSKISAGMLYGRYKDIYQYFINQGKEAEAVSKGLTIYHCLLCAVIERGGESPSLTVSQQMKEIQEKARKHIESAVEECNSLAGKILPQKIEASDIWFQRPYELEEKLALYLKPVISSTSLIPPPPPEHEWTDREIGILKALVRAKMTTKELVRDLEVGQRGIEHLLRSKSPLRTSGIVKNQPSLGYYRTDINYP